MIPRDQRLGVVVVHHFTPQAVLKQALARLASAAPDAKVVVVDTGDGRALDLEPPGPQVLEVIVAENHSYSRAVNLGLKRLTEPFLVVMNADVLVEPDTFERLLAALDEDSGAGLAGPLALTPRGHPQDLGLPYRLAYARALRAGGSGTRVAWLSGCLQLIERRVYENIGGYDETFRFFNEDLEYCSRARRAGFYCRLVAAPVVHVGGLSTPAHPAFHVEGRRGGYVLSERYRSQLYRFLHRGFLRAEALIGSRFSRDEAARAGHAAMARLLATGDWGTSPFGPTLDER